jgi:hypothetical protein
MASLKRSRSRRLFAAPISATRPHGLLCAIGAVILACTDIGQHGVVALDGFARETAAQVDIAHQQQELAPVGALA